MLAGILITLLSVGRSHWGIEHYGLLTSLLCSPVDTDTARDLWLEWEKTLRKPISNTDYFDIHVRELHREARYPDSRMSALVRSRVLVGAAIA